MKDEILKIAEEIKQEVIDIRRQIHMHPETGFEEKQTSELVISKLKELDLELQTKVAKYGVIATIKGGAGDGKTVAIRADMDALDLQELNDVPYKSKIDGKMHACGHDAHTAMLIGVAKILVKLKDKIKGNIKLFFQPAEEGLGGALPMVQEGALKNPDVSAVIALHVEDETDSGKIKLIDGPISASSDVLSIDITGKGGHAAYPHDVIDPIMIGAQIVTAIQTVTSRYTDPINPVVVTVATFHSGSIYNVIPDSAHLTGSIRALSPQVRDDTHKHLEKIIKGVAESFGAKAEVTIKRGYSPGINDPELNKIFKEASDELYGSDVAFTKNRPGMGAEDFFEFSDNYRIPVSMFHLGIRNKGKGIIAPIHNPKFDVDEDALPIGYSVLAFTAIKYLEKS
ncbi:MAG: M20 metallopeptidase family protein [Candidatus Heimdallarchaeota archaeon]